jgi:hypothetical protein
VGPVDRHERAGQGLRPAGQYDSCGQGRRLLRIDGTTTAISNGHICNLMVIPAPTGDEPGAAGICLIVAEVDDDTLGSHEAGSSTRWPKKTQDTVEPTFEGMRVGQPATPRHRCRAHRGTEGRRPRRIPLLLGAIAPTRGGHRGDDDRTRGRAALRRWRDSAAQRRKPQHGGCKKARWWATGCRTALPFSACSCAVATREVALHLLVRPDLSIGSDRRATRRLGAEHVHRSFRRWFSETPLAHRQRLFAVTLSMSQRL